MRTSIEFRPEVHPTQRTTFVRVDDVFKITVRVEDERGQRVDTPYNFNGLVTGYNLPLSEPNIHTVSIMELGENRDRYSISVRMYHAADAQEDMLPKAGYLPNIESSELPVNVWDITRDGEELPGENNAETCITPAMRHAQLEERYGKHGVNRNRNYNNNLDKFLDDFHKVRAERRYLYRGEAKHHGSLEVTSKLVRDVISNCVLANFGEGVMNSWNRARLDARQGTDFGWFLHKIQGADFDRSLFQTQKNELKIALNPNSLIEVPRYIQATSFHDVKDYPSTFTDARFKEEELQLLAKIQHFGGKTMLIDFTQDWKVALFFACRENPDEDGRFILLPEEKENELWHRVEPQEKFPRYEAQKSVLVVPEMQCIFPNLDGVKIVTIPQNLKCSILEYLSQEGITHESLFDGIPEGLPEYLEKQKNRKIEATYIPVFVDSTNAKGGAATRLVTLSQPNPAHIRNAPLLNLSRELLRSMVATYGIDTMRRVLDELASE